MPIVSLNGTLLKIERGKRDGRVGKKGGGVKKKKKERRMSRKLTNSQVLDWINHNCKGATDNKELGDVYYTVDMPFTRKLYLFIKKRRANPKDPKLPSLVAQICARMKSMFTEITKLLKKKGSQNVNDEVPCPYMFIPIFLNFTEVSYMRSGKYKKTCNDEETNHCFLIVNDIAHKNLFFLDSLPDEDVYWIASQMMDLMIKSDVYKNTFGKMVDPNLKEGKYKFARYRRSVQKDNLCTYYTCLFADLYICGEEMQDIVDADDCNDDCVAGMYAETIHRTLEELEIE